LAGSEGGAFLVHFVGGSVRPAQPVVL